MDGMTDERLAEIATRRAAVSGTWHHEHDSDHPEHGCVHIGNYGWTAGWMSCGAQASPHYDEDTEQGHADAEFIAHAPEDVELLHAEVLRLRAELARRENAEWWDVDAYGGGGDA